MRKAFLAVFCTAFFIISSGCLVWAGDAEILGTGIGAAVGGLFGSSIGRGGGQFAATSVGVVTGGLVGDEIGHSIDQDNRYAAQSAPNRPVTIYSNAPNIAYSSYRPNYVAPPAPSPIYAAQGNYCRQYSQITNYAGRAQESYGIACLQSDGYWHIEQ